MDAKGWIGEALLIEMLELQSAHSECLILLFFAVRGVFTVGGSARPEQTLSRSARPEQTLSRDVQHSENAGAENQDIRKLVRETCAQRRPCECWVGLGRKPRCDQVCGRK